MLKEIPIIFLFDLYCYQPALGSTALKKIDFYKGN